MGHYQLNKNIMSTENETRPDGLEREEGQRVSRDGGYQSEGQRGYRPRINYNREGGNRPYRPYNASNGQQGYNRYNNNNAERPRRPRFYSNNEEGTEGGANRSYRPRTNYNNSGEQRPYRSRPSYNPNYNYNNGEGGQPQRSYRPRFNSQGGQERPQRAYSSSYYDAQNEAPQGRPSRPRPNSGYGRPNAQRPRFNQPSGNAPRPRRQQRTPEYNPNAKYNKKKQIEYKEVFVDPNEPIRLNKYLANAGICSRREADEFITSGAVMVNGNVVTELGTKILRSDEVKFHDQVISLEKKTYILLNKPKDTVTTSDDPQARKTVMDLVKDACEERIYPVGRLDRNTTGVLLLTNDGELASKLTHPKFMKKKIYQVQLDKDLTRADMDQLVQGIELEDGEIHADAISYVAEDKKNQVGIEIHSGRNRIVRRLFEHLGYKVVKLDRVYFAGLTKKGLKRGDWRFLTEAEVNVLRMGAFE